MYIPDFWCGVIATIVVQVITIGVEWLYVKVRNLKEGNRNESSYDKSRFKSVR